MREKFSINLAILAYTMLIATVFATVVQGQSVGQPPGLSQSITTPIPGDAVPPVYMAVEEGSDCYLVNFEGIGNEQPVGIHTTPIGVDIVFGTSWLGLVDLDAGGSGNFANEPSPSTVAFFLDQNNITITFSQGLQMVEFWYTAAANSIPVVIRAYDEDTNLIDIATGNVVGTSYDGAACSGDPDGEFCLWATVSLASTTNNIHSIEISGTTSNYFGIDDFRVCRGDCSPPDGQEPKDQPIPIPDQCPPANPASSCVELRDFDSDGDLDCKLWSAESDIEEQLELWCVDDSLDWYGLFFTPPAGVANRVGVCPWECGRNLGIMFHAGDVAPANGVPDCFVRTWWRSRDGDENDHPLCHDDDGDGLSDWFVYTYDAISNKLSWAHLESPDGPGGPAPATVVTHVDPEVGPETEAFFDGLIADLQMQPPGGTMGTSDYALCDLNQDGACNSADGAIFYGALGTCIGDTGFWSLADGNGDGCVTVHDQGIVLAIFADGFESGDSSAWSITRN
jgi:hypothetical protein